MALLIRNGTLVTAAETFAADVLVEGEKISRIGKDLPLPESSKVIDATGKFVLPGGVDPHTHFDLPMLSTFSSDDHYTGHKAAAFGGTTTVMDFVPHDNIHLSENISAWQAKVSKKAVIDFGFHMNITQYDEDVLKEIPRLVEEGVSSVKVFMAYKNIRLDDGEIFRVMQAARQGGILTMLHAEMGDVVDALIAEALAAGNTSPVWHGLTRPAWGAVEATLRGIALAAQAEAPLYIVHMNAGGEVDMLAYGQKKGVAVMGETCPQYLFFTTDHLRRTDGAKWVCSPPVRTQEDAARLWEGLADGTLSVIGTDHCPFFYDGSRSILYDGKKVAIPGKELGRDDFSKIPNGLPGVGDRLPILWTYGVGTGRITPNQFVALNCTNPAKIFGLYPQKGCLNPGSDADIVIWDAHKKVKYGVNVAQHRTDYNLYEGWELTGFPEKVLLRGNLIVDEGRWLGQPGMGRYLRRATYKYSI